MQHIIRPPLHRFAILLLAAALLSCRLVGRAFEREAEASAAPKSTEITSPANIAPAGSTATPTLPPAAGNVIYTEKFEGPTVSGWTMEAVNDEYAQVQRDLFGGAYRWRITAMQDVFSWMYPDLPVSPPSPDFYYAVTVHLGDAPADIAYGPLFDVRDGGNLYYFKVSQLGQFALYARTNNIFTALVGETTTTDIFTGPQAVNRLAVERTGGLVRLYANDHVLIETPLPTTGGAIGLAAELLTGQTAQLAFDDIVLCTRRCP